MSVFPANISSSSFTGEHLLQYTEPHYGQKISLAVHPDTFMENLSEVVGALCYDIFSCTGITKDARTVVEFVSLCAERTRLLLAHARDDREAMRMTEGKRMRERQRDRE